MRRVFDSNDCAALGCIGAFVGAVTGGTLAVGFGLIFFTWTKAVGGGLVGMVVGFFVAGMASYVVAARAKE